MTNRPSYKTLYQQGMEEITLLREQLSRQDALIRACRTAVQEALEDRQAALDAAPAGARELLANLLACQRDRAPIDLAGIARHMRVDPLTPQQWNQRGLLPPRDFPEIKHPLWRASTIRDQFAIPTGRAWFEDDEEDAGQTAGEAAA